MDLLSMIFFILNALSRPRNATQQLTDILVKDGITFLAVCMSNLIRKFAILTARHDSSEQYYRYLSVRSIVRYLPSASHALEAVKIATVLVIAKAPVRTSKYMTLL